MVLLSALVGIYYNVIVAYTLFYFFSSLTSNLPWANCQNWWNNKETCRESTGQLHFFQITKYFKRFIRIQTHSIPQNQKQVMSLFSKFESCFHSLYFCGLTYLVRLQMNHPCIELLIYVHNLDFKNYGSILVDLPCLPRTLCDFFADFECVIENIASSEALQFIDEPSSSFIGRGPVFSEGQCNSSNAQNLDNLTKSLTSLSF